MITFLGVVLLVVGVMLISIGIYAAIWVRNVGGGALIAIGIILFASALIILESKADLYFIGLLYVIGSLILALSWLDRRRPTQQVDEWELLP